MKRRKWKMWARVHRGEYSINYTPELSFYRQDFKGMTNSYEQVIRVEVRELPRKRRARRG